MIDNLGDIIDQLIAGGAVLARPSDIMSAGRTEPFQPRPWFVSSRVERYAFDSDCVMPLDRACRYSRDKMAIGFMSCAAIPAATALQLCDTVDRDTVVLGIGNTVAIWVLSTFGLRGFSNARPDQSDPYLFVRRHVETTDWDHRFLVWDTMDEDDYMFFSSLLWVPHVPMTPMEMLAREA